jgi:hypothetical protein
MVPVLRCIRKLCCRTIQSRIIQFMLNEISRAEHEKGWIIESLLLVHFVYNCSVTLCSESHMKDIKIYRQKAEIVNVANRWYMQLQPCFEAGTCTTRFIPISIASYKLGCFLISLKPGDRQPWSYINSLHEGLFWHLSSRLASLLQREQLSEVVVVNNVEGPTTNIPRQKQGYKYSILTIWNLMIV